MKFNKDEKFMEIYEFVGEGIKELTVESLRKSVIPLATPRELDLPLRDRLLEIEFNEEGFKDFKKGATEVKGVELLNYTIWNEIDLGEESEFELAPNYIVNIKNNEIYNIFDTLERMKFYNFLTDVMNGDFNNWKIVTAIDRLYTFPDKEIEISHNKDISDEDILNKIFDGDLPIELVNNLLEKHDISLITSEETLTSLATKLKVGQITQEDIINRRF